MNPNITRRELNILRKLFLFLFIFFNNMHEQITDSLLFFYQGIIFKKEIWCITRTNCLRECFSQGRFVETKTGNSS